MGENSFQASNSSKTTYLALEQLFAVLRNVVSLAEWGYIWLYRKYSSLDQGIVSAGRKQRASTCC